MNFISFSEYLQTWRGWGLTDQQAAERLLAALRDPANARHVQGFRIEREAITPSADEQRWSWRASERKDRVARWLESARAWRNQQLLAMLQKWVSTRSQPLSPERWGSLFWAAYRLQREIDDYRERGEPGAQLRPISARRRAALERAWRRLHAAAQPEERHAETVSNAPEVVPAHLWTYLDCVDVSLVSYWTDDNDDPEAGISVNWRAGKLTDWDWSSTIEYCGLEVHNTLARPTRGEVADLMNKSPITDQNIFWKKHKNYLKEARIKSGKDYADFWAANKNPERSPGPIPKRTDRMVPAVEL